MVGGREEIERADFGEERVGLEIGEERGVRGWGWRERGV